MMKRKVEKSAYFKVSDRSTCLNSAWVDNS